MARINDLSGCQECGVRIECSKCGEYFCPGCLTNHEENCQEEGGNDGR